MIRITSTRHGNSATPTTTVRVDEASGPVISVNAYSG